MPSKPEEKLSLLPENNAETGDQSQAVRNLLPLLSCPPQQSPNKSRKSQNRNLKTPRSSPPKRHANYRSQSATSFIQSQDNLPQSSQVLPDQWYEPFTSANHGRLNNDCNYVPYFTPYDQTNFRYRNSLLSPASLSKYQSVYYSSRQPYGNRTNSSDDFITN